MSLRARSQSRGVPELNQCTHYHFFYLLKRFPYFSWTSFVHPNRHRERERAEVKPFPESWRNCAGNYRRNKKRIKIKRSYSIIKSTSLVSARMNSNLWTTEFKNSRQDYSRRRNNPIRQTPLVSKLGVIQLICRYNLI